MKKIILLFLFCSGIFSCGEKKAETVEEDTSKSLVALKKLPKLVEPNEKAALILKDWTEYNALNAAYKGIYSVDTKEDLTVVLEGLIEKQKLLEESTYPKEFDRPDIKSRQKIVKTYVQKINSDMEFGINPRESVLEMVRAYNAFNNQFSVVVNSSLDPNIFLNE